VSRERERGGERKGRVFAIYKGVPTKLDMGAEERES